MVLLQNYALFALASQVCLGIINGLFVLNDASPTVALIGLYGVYQADHRALMLFLLVESISIAVDIAKVVIWSPFILNEMLQSPATLGVYYLVLSVFQIVIKIVCGIFTLVVRRGILKTKKNPQKQSTVTERSAWDKEARMMQPTDAYGELLNERTHLIQPRRRKRAASRHNARRRKSLHSSGIVDNLKAELADSDEEEEDDNNNNDFEEEGDEEDEERTVSKPVTITNDNRINITQDEDEFGKSVSGEDYISFAKI